MSKILIIKTYYPSSKSNLALQIITVKFLRKYIWLSEKSDRFIYWSFLKSKLRHGYFSANIAKFLEHSCL